MKPDTPQGRREVVLGVHAPSEQRLTLSLLDALPAIMAVLDPRGVIVTVNSAWESFGHANGLGWPGSGLGASYLEVCERAAQAGDAYARQALEGLHAVLRGDLDAFQLEYPCDSPTETRWFVLHAAPYEMGDERGAVILHIDISARRKAELDAEEKRGHLEAKATRLANILDLSIDAICTLDADGRFLSVSAAAERIWGLAPERLVGTTVFDLAIQADRAATRLAIDRLLSGDRVRLFENRCHREGSSEPTCHVMWSGQWVPQQSLVYAVARDVTDLRVAARRTESLTRRLTTTLEHIPDGFYLLDRDWCFSYVNMRAAEILGRKREELLGRVIWEAFPDAKGTIFEERYRAAAGSGHKVAFEAYYAGIDRWASVLVYPTQQGLAVYFVDITEHHRAVEALRESEARLNLIARATTDAIWEWNPATGAVWWSEGIRTLFGVSPDRTPEGIESWLRRIHPDDYPRITQRFQDVLDAGGTSFSSEYRFRRADGSYAFVLDRGFVERDQDGHPVRVAGGLTDLSEQRHAEREAQLAAEKHAFIVRAQLDLGNPELGRDAILQLMCERSRELTNADGALVELVDTDSTIIRYATESHAMMLGHVVPLAGSISGEVLRDGRPILCEDAREDRRVEKSIAPEAGAVSMIAAPLRAGTEAVGVIKVVCARPAGFKPMDVDNLQMLAEYLRVVLQRMQMERERDRVNRLRQLLSLSNLAQARQDEEVSLLQEICGLAVEVGGYHVAWVAYSDEESPGRLLPVAGAGEGAAILSGASLRARGDGHDPTSRALRDGTAVTFSSLPDDDDHEWPREARSLGIRSAMFLPLTAGVAATFGVLCLYSDEAGGFADDEQDMLKDMAGDLAFGIRHIRSQRERRRLEAAVVAVAAGVSASDTRQYFERLCSSVADALGAPAAFVARVVRHSGHPRVRTLAGCVDGKSVAPIEYDCAGTPCERLLETDEVVIADGLDRQAVADTMGVHGVCAYVGRSLIDSKGLVVGLLFVMWRTPLRSIEFSTSTLRIFATRAASELERRQSEIRLREQASLLDQAKDAILVRDLDGRVRYWNKGAERLYGWTADEMMAGRMTHVLNENPAELEAALQAVIEKGEWNGVMNQRHRDGRAIPTEAHWTLVRDGEGRPQSVFAINTDISRRLAVEAQLRQSQRLEAVGQLTGGVAHDFNNLLTVILGNAELLTELLEKEPHLREMAEMVRSAAQRGADLTQQLLAFARRQKLEPQAIAVDRLINGMTGLLRRTLPERITLERHAEPDLWEALVDPGQLEAALLNLALNARDAMPRGGRLEIDARNLRVPAGALPDLAPGDYVRVRVSDTGSGIPPELLPRVIEPFFTTKPVGKGTGLGLSMVYGFAKQSQGHLAIESEEGKGTAITLYLPRAAPSGTQIAPDPAARPQRGTESILLAEDDPLVRRHAEGLLRQLGYRVTAVADAQSALDILAGGAEVDLLFTDVVMPGELTGPELVEAARRIRPGLPALYTSGYTESALDDLPAERGALLLRKPYQRAELAQKVRAALAEAPSRRPASPGGKST